VGVWWEHGEMQVATPAQLCCHGWGLWNRGRFADALAFFREAAGLDDWAPEPLWGMAKTLEGLGMETEAAEALWQYQTAAALAWDGGALKGRLLVGEPGGAVPDAPGYGLGDVVQGVRWLKAAAERAGAPAVLLVEVPAYVATRGSAG
jgi:hypothetical protein